MDDDIIQHAIEGDIDAQIRATKLVKRFLGCRSRIGSLDALTIHSKHLGLAALQPGFAWAYKTALALLPPPLKLVQDLIPSHLHALTFTEDACQLLLEAQSHVIEEVLPKLYERGCIDSRFLVGYISAALDRGSALLITSVDIFVASMFHKSNGSFRVWLTQVAQLVFLRSTPHRSCIVQDITQLESMPRTRHE